jgi:hypothetical protein
MSTMLGEARKALDDPEDTQGAAKKQKKEEKKERETPTYPWCGPMEFDWAKGVMAAFSHVTCKLSEEDFMRVKTQGETIHNDIQLDDEVGCIVKYAPRDGHVIVTFHPMSGDGIYGKYATNLLEFIDSDELWQTAKLEAGFYHFEVYLLRKHHDDIDLPSSTSHWRFHCLMHDPSKYAKPVHLTVGKEKETAVALLARDVEYNAPALAQMMRRNIDNAMSDAAVELHLGDKISEEAATLFLKHVTTGDAKGWCSYEDPHVIEQVMKLARTWMADDKPTVRSSHVPLYEWLLEELWQDIRGEAGFMLARRLSLLSIVAEYSKDKLLPRLWHTLAEGLNKKLDEM